MSNDIDFSISNDTLNAKNIYEFSRDHPVFNASRIQNIEINADLIQGASPGDSLVWDGTEFILSRSLTGPVGITGSIQMYDTDTSFSGVSTFRYVDGKVGINTVNPAYPLEINTGGATGPALRLTYNTDGTGTVDFDVNSTGDLTINPSGNYVSIDNGMTGTVSYGGIEWVLRTSAADNQWNSVCWSPELTLFVAVATSGTGNRVMTSPDGITWTIRTSAVDNNWTNVCWSSSLSLFVAVSNSGTGNRVMTSPDGITWTIRTSAADNSWNSVCWSPELTLFVAIAYSGVGNRVMTSPDGITWTIRTSAANNSWFSVCWSPSLSLFVAVAYSGTGNRVMTSPDGITWTIRTSAANNSWFSVCWSPELSLFVAVASSGTGNRVMTSENGITWTIRTSAADNNWINVCWSPELLLFVAVAYSGTGNRVMTSPDGINWSIRTSAADNNWISVCWSPELSMFVAVANTGTGDRVMTSVDIPNTDLCRLGIGITPSYQLEVYADSAAKPTTNTWIVSSDIRIKKDITGANLELCYNNIKNIPLRRFKWDETYYNNLVAPDRHMIGFIAQEVKEYFPKSINILPKKRFSNNKELSNFHSLNIDQINKSMIGAVKKVIEKTEKTQESITNINSSMTGMYENLQTQIDALTLKSLDLLTRIETLES